MVCNFIKKKKTLARVFPVSFPESFKKIYFVEHVRTDAWVKPTKKVALTKCIHMKTPVMASFLVLFQKGVRHRCFSRKLSSFKEHHFTEKCCRTASDFL